MTTQLMLFPEVKKSPYPQTQLKAVIYFLERMDAEMVGTILDNGKTYQDMPKGRFISLLSSALESIEAKGDKKLRSYKGLCSGCNKGCDGFTLLSKQGHYIDLIYEMKDGRIHDIFECMRLVNFNDKIKKINQIYINNTDDFFPEDDEPPF
jgi:hypothetical protein